MASQELPLVPAAARVQCPTCRQQHPDHAIGCTQPLCIDCGEPVPFETRHRVVLGEHDEHPLELSRCDPQTQRWWQERKRYLRRNSYDRELPAEGLRNPDISIRGEWW